MKVSRILGALGFLAASVFAQLQPGDIAFTGFVADPPDGLAFVALKDIPANTRIYFCDANWSGTAFPANEGDWSWTSSSVVPAGTVVKLDSVGLTGFKPSVGSLVHNNSGGISTSSEAVYAYLVSSANPDSVRKPSVFLAAISNNNYGADPGVLTGTGLVQDSTAIRLKPTADIAAYVGPRAGLTQTGYLAALKDTLNWITQDNSGTADPSDGTAPDLPFNTTAFAFGASVVDTIKPTVTGVSVTSATTLEVTFSEPVDSVTAVNPARYGLTPALSVTSVSYLKAQNKAVVTHAAFVGGTGYVLQVSGIEDTANNVMAAYNSASLVFGVQPALSFNVDHYTVKENSGSVVIRLNASAAPTDTAKVDLQLVTGGTAVAGTDFTFSNMTYSWPKDSAGFRTISIPITNNGASQADRFFVLDLKTPVKATLGTNTRLVVYILDDDIQPPAKSNELALKFVSSYKVDTSGAGSSEIVGYDPASKRLFAMNSTKDKLEIMNFRNPRALTKVATIDLLAFGSGGTSVAVKNGLVAATIDAANFQPGKVVFLDTNGTVLKSVTAGSLPDMVTFSPDGKFVLTANEGQPSTDYLTDPEGSVSVIDISGGIAGVTQANVTTMTFNAFDAQKTALMAAGVRIFGANNPTVSKDLEPEYVTVSADSKTAWITLQENNAIAKANLVTKTITNIYPLGLKDHSLAKNSFDASDALDSVFMGTWPVKGMYMPDGIANLAVGDTTYLFTANEGDAREYGSFVEEIKVGAAGYKLDSLKFPNAAILKLNNNLGRLAVSSMSGDLDGDGDFDEIHAFGARSMSVWNGATGAQVWDGGNDLELITARDSAYGKIFNASNDNATFKNRSDNKGPEPEGITIGKIGAKSYAFMGMERTGGFVAYDVTDPKAPRYVAYANNRSLSGTANSDLGPEGIIFIPRASSPNDTALIVLANEVSATVSVYSVRDTNGVSGVRSAQAGPSKPAFTLHRSGDGSMVFFSMPVDFKFSDARGRVLKSGRNAAWVDLGGLTRGRYFLSIPRFGSFSLMVTQ